MGMAAERGANLPGDRASRPAAAGEGDEAPEVHLCVYRIRTWKTQDVPPIPMRWKGVKPTFGTDSRERTRERGKERENSSPGRLRAWLAAELRRACPTR